MDLPKNGTFGFIFFLLFFSRRVAYPSGAEAAAKLDSKHSPHAELGAGMVCNLPCTICNPLRFLYGIGKEVRCYSGWTTSAAKPHLANKQKAPRHNFNQSAEPFGTESSSAQISPDYFLWTLGVYHHPRRRRLRFICSGAPIVALWFCPPSHFPSLAEWVLFFFTPSS